MNPDNNYHKKIFDDINKTIKKIYAYSFTVDSFIDGVLEIHGSSDSWQYWSDEDVIITIKFLVASYICLPTYEFEDPIFRLASTYEIADVEKLVGVGEEETVYCIEAKTYVSRGVLIPFFIVAEGISFQVKRYKDL